jgi:hypothetical protein
MVPPTFDGSRLTHGGFPMPDPLAGYSPRFLRTPDAARFLSLSGRTLEKHRSYGTGPKYRKIGGRVVYAIDDLNAWADLGAKRSTSDPGIGTVFPAKRGAMQMVPSGPSAAPRRG